VKALLKEKEASKSKVKEAKKVSADSFDKYDYKSA